MPKLTPDDLQFLIYDRVALRFQHSEYDRRFQEDGVIKGDAYSLSCPKIWHPPTEANQICQTSNLLSVSPYTISLNILFVMSAFFSNPIGCRLKSRQ